jgi:hypothetical protein
MTNPRDCATIDLPAGAVTFCAVLAQIIARIIAKEDEDGNATRTA